MMQLLLLPLFGSVTCTPENKGIQFDIQHVAKSDSVSVVYPIYFGLSIVYFNLVEITFPKKFSALSPEGSHLKKNWFIFSSTNLLDNKGIIKETSNSLRNHLT